MVLLDYLGIATVLALTFKEAVWDTGGKLWKTKGRAGWKTWVWLVFLIAGVSAMANDWWQTRQDATKTASFREESNRVSGRLERELTIVRHDLEQSKARERAADEKRSQALKMLGESSVREEAMQQSVDSSNTQLGRLLEAVETQYEVEGYEAALAALARVRAVESRVSEVERRTAPRRVTQDEAMRIRDVLRQGPAGSLHVSCNASDSEGCGFADDIVKVFRDAKWYVVMAQSSFSPTVYGFFIGNTGEIPSSACIRAIQALEAAGIRPQPTSFERDLTTMGGKKDCTLLVGVRERGG